jgi:hypothetical protein
MNKKYISEGLEICAFCDFTQDGMYFLTDVSGQPVGQRTRSPRRMVLLVMLYS